MDQFLIILLSINGLFLFILILKMIIKKVTSYKHIAVIKVTGAIVESQPKSVGMSGGNTSSDYMIRLLDRAFTCAGCKAVVLEVNSPGGSPVAASEIADFIWKYREKKSSDDASSSVSNAKNRNTPPPKPIYAVIRSIGASAAYMISSATNRIYANAFSIVGSIGVISMRFGFTELIHKIGIENRVQTAGKDKHLLDPFSPESPEARTYMQSILDFGHTLFIDYVKRGRQSQWGDQPSEDLFTGKFWVGKAALENGLVDEIGNMDTIKEKLKKDFNKSLPMVNYESKDKKGVGIKLLFDQSNLKDVIQSVLHDMKSNHTLQS